MKTVTIAGTTVPALGMGTWNIGDSSAKRAAEIEALRVGLDAGLTVIDTAEMYGSGRSEKLVGEAIAGRRDEVYLVTKVLPSNASTSGVQRACEASLKRLGTDHVDLYLLHWSGGVPLSDTVEGFERLRDQGKIGAWGVSNFDVDDMENLESVSPDCAANQILYSLEYRGTEFDLLERDREAGVVTMAYSPLGQGGDLLQHPALATIARRHGAKPAQVALAWVLRQDNMLAIPKAGTAAHQRDNIEGAKLQLTGEDLAELDAAFAPPKRKRHLAML
jgi:diketogulonate reductase-like aldo/keto reductase